MKRESMKRKGVKKIPVKMKITLWYTVIILLITVGPLTVLAFTADKMTWNRAEGSLKESLEEFMEDVEFYADGYQIDEDAEFYDEGISFSMYDSDGKLIEGNVPAHFPKDTVLKSGKGQTVTSGDRKWLTYDQAYRSESGRFIWFRAVTSAGSLSMMGQILLTLVLLITPVLAVLAVIGGYLVTGRMLKPIEEALERERTFTADVSHELRTPVTVITSESEFALMPEASPEEMKESLAVILKQSGRMSGLIEQLLVLSRGQAGVEQLKMQEVDISVVARLTAEEIREQAEAVDIHIAADICPELKVWGNEDALIRLFINLLENSVRYGKEGGSTKLTLIREGRYIKGSVEDDGIGIKEEELPHIWERFYQADSARTKGKGQGFGLGLPMVRWIVDAHGGEIRVQSKYGEGTKFTFRLPVYQS